MGKKLEHIFSLKKKTKCTINYPCFYHALLHFRFAYRLYPSNCGDKFILLKEFKIKVNWFQLFKIVLKYENNAFSQFFQLKLLQELGKKWTYVIHLKKIWLIMVCSNFSLLKLLNNFFFTFAEPNKHYTIWPKNYCVVDGETCDDVIKLLV